MKTIPMLSLAFAFMVTWAATGRAEESAVAGAKQPAEARAVLHDHAWGPNGELVLGIRVMAGDEPLALGRSQGDTDAPFSLWKSHLVDLHTNQVLKPLARRLRRPYFGPPRTLVNLPPHGWIQLGIAFPAPPQPPLGQDGKPQELKFKFVLPKRDLPLTISIPYQAPPPS